jgi:hypothetical protein
MRAVTLLITAHCASCDHAKDVLGRLAAEGLVEVEVVEAASPRGRALAAAAGIVFPPGVLLGGEAFSFGRLSERKLRQELARRSSPR